MYIGHFPYNDLFDWILWNTSQVNEIALYSKDLLSLSLYFAVHSFKTRVNEEKYLKIENAAIP